MKFLSKLFSLFQTEQQKQFIKRVQSSYKSLDVSDRGVVSVDPAEVSTTPSFKQHLGRAKRVVENSSNTQTL